MKTILNYVEEGWLGKQQNKVEGVVFKYDPDKDDKVRIRDVSEKDILARISGNWKEKLYISLGAKSVRLPISIKLKKTAKLTNKKDSPLITLIDLTPLSVAPKILPPPSTQLPNESLRFWSGVTEAISARQFSRATALKQELEERQRMKAKEREEKGKTWQPRFFVGAVTPLGKPELTEDGREVLKGLQEDRWALTESLELGA